MKSFLTAVAVAATLVSSAACAQERVADAALGGLSGALVLGPVGAVAGVVIGFTAGPSISRSWGAYPDYRYAQRPRSTTVAANQAKSTSAAPARPAGGTADSSASSVKSASAAPARPAWKAPPVVGFE